MKRLLRLAGLTAGLGLALAACSSPSGDQPSGDTTTDAGGPALTVIGQPFTTELYGVGLPLDSPYCEQVNTAIKDMIDDGSWQAELDAEMAGVAYTPNPETNPPKSFETCDHTGSAALVTNGKLTIGIKFDQPHLGFKDGSTYTGFDVDVATYVAGKLGFTPDQIVWVEAVSAQRETLLQNHQVDMIFATYSITDARKEKVEFAGPYFVAGQDLLVRTGTTDITGPESLNDGKKLCSVAGSTPAQKIKDSYASDVQLIEFKTYSECVQALLADKVDAVTTDDIILAGLAAATNAT
ncbi:MAG: transporter substrate-binding domain-containing protein [Propionibacteriaceae bacterium]|jgi:ABC-type amino acid transport substrate-binding protein|nr:transporter substrate-binding domain-containing protein [Propionibacteriaceae bacterium]